MVSLLDLWHEESDRWAMAMAIHAAGAFAPVLYLQDIGTRPAAVPRGTYIRYVYQKGAISYFFSWPDNTIRQVRY